MFSRGKGGREKEGEKHGRERMHQQVASCTPSNRALTSKPRGVPSPGVRPVTFQCMGWRSTNGASRPGIMFTIGVQAYFM